MEFMQGVAAYIEERLNDFPEEDRARVEAVIADIRAGVIRGA